MSTTNVNPAGEYHRYHIETANAAGIARWPSRFQVRVGKLGLAKLLIGELIHTRFNLEVVTSRPCMYGVFSGPIGGFAPRPQHCVGCLRCMAEFPEFVSVSPNPERRKLGDSYFNFNYVDQVTYEAETGLVPVKGAGYRGRFGGEGWDGMWTDMSEIVRPTRDGIHGREFISTSVDIGSKPEFLVFDGDGQPLGETPNTFSLPVPFIFDAPPVAVESTVVWQILSTAAQNIQSLVVVPAAALSGCDLDGSHLVPLVRPEEAASFSPSFTPRLIELDGWEPQVFRALQTRFPDSLICLRLPFTTGEVLLSRYREGVRVFHLTASYHGIGMQGGFVGDLIRQAHSAFVQAGRREAVTLIGSGGMIAAEHLPKAILCGLDLVALDTPLMVALQGRFEGECEDRLNGRFSMPRALSVGWGVQRLKNLSASWRDQLLEILGAMGLREVRRLRGELGRAMFMQDLEAEAFAGIDGYGR
jgi:hypothetical protein